MEQLGIRITMRDSVVCRVTLFGGTGLHHSGRSMVPISMELGVRAWRWPGTIVCVCARRGLVLSGRSMVVGKLRTAGITSKEMEIARYRTSCRGEMGFL